MRKYKIINKYIWFLIFLITFIIFCSTFPYQLFICAKDNVFLTQSEYNQLIKNNKYISSKMKNVIASNVDEETLNQYVLEYNLFNLFNITSLKVKIVEDEKIILSGNCLGFSLQSKGVTVVGSNYFLTKNGAVNPFQQSELKVGDTILKIGGKEVIDISDIFKYLSSCNGETIALLVMRDNQEINVNITPKLDIQTNAYKLGLWVKNDATGVGTLTYIKPTNNRFGALGHSINKNNSEEPLQISQGEIFNCNVIGVNEGQKGIPGELLGIFSKTNPQGNVDKNNEYGVFGNIYSDSGLLNNVQEIQVGGKTSAKAGKAQIYSCVNGNEVSVFEIEIIKTNYQASANEKSLVFRVTDENLLQKTGGIVQGMSGSPIVQDGKIIGAVTHVFVNDPTKGFGIYLDWMINN